MNKYNNPRLLNTVVSGTGMKNPVRPHVIIGSEENGFIRGDLMDANAIQEQIVTEIAAREHGDEELTEYIDEKVQQAVDDLVDGAPEVLDTLKELSEALGDDANFATTITEEIASKVDKVEGKGLSTNDYTNAEKQKLAGIAAGAEVNVQSDWSQTNSSNDAFIKNKPTKLSQFENDVPYATESELIETKNIVDILYKTDVDLFDILYDDGTVSSDILTPSSGKTPVGICVGIAADFEDGKARFMALKYGSTIYPNGVNQYSQSMGTNMPFQDDEQFEDLPLYNYISQDCLQDVNGNQNTDIILNSSNPSKYIAANVCRQFDPGYKVGEWYLPSMGELHLMYSNKVKISAVITELRNAGYNNIAEIDGNVPSMSSTEKDDSYIFSYAPLQTNNPAEAKMKNTRTASGLLVRPFLAITPQCRGKVVDIEKDVDELKENLTFTETTDPANGHEYVDLGLPSGTKWATMNVGASSATDYGNYYMYGMGSKTYDSTDTPYSGTEDPLALSADTAAQEWGGDWHMPTSAQMQELIANTTYQWVTNYKGSGINGGTFTATNGAVLFIPVAGRWYGGRQDSVGDYGCCWGSSPNGSNDAYYLGFSYGGKGVGYNRREYGYSVRGVLDKDAQGETTITPVKEVVTDLKSNEEVIAAALNNLNTKIEVINLRIETDDLDEAVNTLKNRQYMDSSTFNAIFTEADSDAIGYIIDNFAPTFYVKVSSNGVAVCSIVRSATQVCVFRHAVDRQVGNAIQDFRCGRIKIDGTIEWSDWTTTSSTVTPDPAA